MAEWSKAPVWRAGWRVTVTRVRIPISPQPNFTPNFTPKCKIGCFFQISQKNKYFWKQTLKKFLMKREIKYVNKAKKVADLFAIGEFLLLF